MDNQKVKLGITQGDPSGVGMELILRVFADQFIYKYCIPVVYGNTKSFIAWKKHLNLQEPMYHLVNSAAEAKEGKLNWVSSSDQVFDLTIGTPSPESGKEALLAIDKAIADAQFLDALVTAPIDKSTVAPHSPNFTGQSKYLTQEKIEQKIEVVHESLRNDFNVLKPRIAVLGLNPHAGDQGLLGDEETKIIQPAIAKHFKMGKLVYGPYSADSFFGSGNYKNFDAVIAMYHDQGLIPFKTMSFMDGVNVTAGLSIIRTSPDHGTAYDIAGKMIADPSSMRAAVYDAIHLVRNRKQFVADFENPLEYAELRRERFRIDF